MSYVFEKYVARKETLKHVLDKYGVAIIPSVLNDEQCEKMLNGIWDFFEYISQTWENPIDRNNKDTWREIYKLFPMHSMLFQHWNIGQSQVCWDLRQNRDIVEMFAAYWGCTIEELLVSFDGLSFNMPPEVTRRGWNRENTWYHTDQNFKRNDRECIQSWVTALDVEDGDATLGFYEKSHLFHKEFQETFQTNEKGDWYKLKKEEEEFFISKGCELHKIKCPKGSLVFWDSRTIHCGVEANKSRENQKFRAIVYLCYQPRELATAANLRKKQKAFNEMRMTTHWPAKVKLFPKNPRTYGNPLPEITKIQSPNLTELGKKLAGF
jgi:hypothetical protein